MQKTWKIGALALAIAMAISLPGCRIREEEKAEQPQKREEIVLWSYYETEVQKKALDELTEGFNGSQDKYELTWEYHGPVTEFNKKLAIGITQKQLPDIVIIDNPDMRRYVEQGFAEDITEEIQDFDNLDKYYPNVLSSVIYDERYYGLPFCCNNTGLIYNKKMLEEKQAAVPESWEEFVEAAKLLTDGNTKGFALSAIEGEQSAFQILPFILSAGDEPDSLGGEGTRAALELMAELVAAGTIPKDCVNWSQNDVAQKFIDSDIAMMENGPWVLPALDEAGVDYGVARLPYDKKSVGVAGGENLCVLKGKNVEGAVAFMEYYNQEQVMLDVALRADSMPPREDLAERMLSVKPQYQIFIEQMPECITRSAYKEWPQMTQRLSDAQFQIITGTATPEEACAMIGEKD